MDIALENILKALQKEQETVRLKIDTAVQNTISKHSEKTVNVKSNIDVMEAMQEILKTSENPEKLETEVLKGDVKEAMQRIISKKSQNCEELGSEMSRKDIVKAMQGIISEYSGNSETIMLRVNVKETIQNNILVIYKILKGIESERKKMNETDLTQEIISESAHQNDIEKLKIYIDIEESI